jgi:hypothetical protein
MSDSDAEMIKSLRIAANATENPALAYLLSLSADRLIELTELTTIPVTV